MCTPLSRPTRPTPQNATLTRALCSIPPRGIPLRSHGPCLLLPRGSSRPSQALRLHFGNERMDTAVPTMGSPVMMGRKPRPGEYPRSPSMMACIPYMKRGTCQRYEETGWCPFDHPYEARGVCPFVLTLALALTLTVRGP